MAAGNSDQDALEGRTGGVGTKVFHILKRVTGGGKSKPSTGTGKAPIIAGKPSASDSDVIATDRKFRFRGGAMDIGKPWFQWCDSESPSGQWDV